MRFLLSINLFFNSYAPDFLTFLFTFIANARAFTIAHIHFSSLGKRRITFPTEKTVRTPSPFSSPLDFYIALAYLQINVCNLGLVRLYDPTPANGKIGGRNFRSEDQGSQPLPIRYYPTATSKISSMQ